MKVEFKYNIGQEVWTATGVHPAVRGTVVTASIGKWGTVEYRVSLCGVIDSEWRLESEIFARELDARRGYYEQRIKRLGAELAAAEMELAKLKEEDKQDD